MYVSSSDLTTDYRNGIDKVPPGSGGKRSRHHWASTKDRKTHLAGDRFGTSAMTVSLKSMTW
jgi:hypothetical protein